MYIISMVAVISLKQDNSMVIKMYTIKIGANEIEYTISRRAKKYINISIKGDKTIHVSAPRRVPIYEIEKVLKEKSVWIENKMNSFTSNKNKFENENILWYIGLPYQLKVIQNLKNDVTIVESSIIINTKYIEKNYIKQVYEKWLYKQAEELYYREVYYWLEIMKEYNLILSKIQIRKMKSRWGSCIPSKNKICLNTALMKVPKQCIEYVILHELTHLIEPNHSKNFYFIVEKYMADWKARKDKLNKEFGNIL